MGFWNKPSGISTPNMDKFSFGTGGSQITSQPLEFYEIEPAIVLDIILDKSHPYFTGHSIDPNRTPPDVSGKKPSETDPDFTWVGRALVRLVYSHKRVEKEKLIWALPLESNISEYPLLNELVGVVKHLGTYYYTRKINRSNYVNANPDFNAEITVGGFRQSQQSPIEGNRELQLSPTDNRYIAYQGPISKMNVSGDQSWSGALGRYFLFNNRIRNLRRREGDLVFESRFGQSIRFAAYDDNRNNDKGVYTDYLGNGTKYIVDDNIDIGSGGVDASGGGINTRGNTATLYEAGGGNPMILIRNRQRQITTKGKVVNAYSKNGFDIMGTEDEKNVGGLITEDINSDGSSIHITSGATISGFVTTCYKKMFGQGEEQPAYQPSGATSFVFPKLSGDQIVINSDRVVISAKSNEMFFFSKARMAFVTDNEFTVDAQDQIVLTTNNKTVINSPTIYLGEYNETGEPVLLGQTSINWMRDLCDWLINHTHWYIHKHPDAGQADPIQTQQPVQIERLKILRDSLPTLASKRVFTVGGGFAPGSDGVGLNSVKVDVSSGSGIPVGADSSGVSSATEDVRTNYVSPYSGKKYKNLTESQQAEIVELEKAAGYKEKKK